MKILIATEKPFAPVAVEGIKHITEENGYTLEVLEKYNGKEELKAKVADADALIIRSDKIDEEIFEAAKQLKIVVRAGAGYDNVDLEAATKHGVVVMNTPGQNANAVAELVFGLLVFTVRNFFNGKAGTELKGKTIGIVAFGNVGRNVARIARGFEMQVQAYDIFTPEEKIKEAGVTPVKSLEELFATSDIISLHLPATKDTIKSINATLVSKAKKGSVIVNTARKEIIDEEGMLKVMEERKDLRFITDIKPDEDVKFRSAFPDRYFSTPKKMGAQTAEANVNAGLAAARQIAGFLKEGITKFQVNK